MRNGDGSGVVFAMLCVIFMALGNIWTKKGGVGLSSLEVSVVRLYFGCAGLIIVVLVMGRMRDIGSCLKQKESRRPLLMGAFLGSYLGIWCMMYGFLFARSVGIAATLTATSPIFVLPVVKILYDERISLRAISGSLIAVGGVVVLVL